MKTAVRVALVLVIACSALGGCRSSAQRAERNPNAVLLDAPAGRLGVDVQNDMGNVTIIVDPTATRASIVARLTDAMKADPNLVVADLVDDSTGSVLRVVGAHDSQTSSPIEITVRVPVCAGVRVRNNGGPVVIRGVTGAIDVAAGGSGAPGGSVVISTSAPLTSPITIQTAEGHIIVEAGVGTVGTVEANAPAGEVRSEITGTATEQMRQTPSGWSAKLGGSNNPIRLTADHGSITLRIGRVSPLYYEE